MFPFYYNLVKTWKKNLMYSRSIKQELWPETGLMAAKNIFKISKYRHQNNLWNPFEVYKACQTSRRKACQTSRRKLYVNIVNGLTNFTPLISFYTPWKHQRTFGFLFSGGYGKRPVVWNGLKTLFTQKNHFYHRCLTAC